MASPSDNSSSSTLARVARWGGGLLGGLLVLVLAAALLIPQFFTSEELKGYVVPPMEEATGRQVQIDEIGLRILWSPAVSVSGFRLANREGYGPEPAVSAAQLNVEVALWPLLTGSIEPTAVELVDPVVRYEVATDGSTNFDDLMGGEEQPAEEGGGGGIGIPISNFRTTGGQVRYEDKSTGQALHLDFNAQLSALPDGDALTSAGTINIEALRAVLPSVQADTMTVTDAVVTYDVRAALGAGELSLNQLTVETAPLTLKTTGTVTELNTTPVLDLTVETPTADLGKLAAFAPATAVDGLNPRGTLQLTTTIKGPLSDASGSMKGLTVDGSGALSGVGVDYQGAKLLRDLSADIALSLDEAALRSLQGTLLGKPLKGEVAVTDLMEAPRVNGRLAGAADLSELTALAGGESVSGAADYDVRFAGPVNNPDAIRPTGQIRLTTVRYPYESFRHPIEIPDATVKLTGTGLSMDRFQINTGEQSMALRTTVTNLFPISKGLAETNPAMAVDFAFTSDRLDLVELYPEPKEDEVFYSQLFAATLSGSKVNGKSPEAVANELYGGTELPAFAVDGTVKIATFLNDPQRIDDLSVDVRMRNRRLVANNLSGKTYGGQLAGSVTFDQSGAATSELYERESVLMATARPGPAPLASSSSVLDYDITLTDAKASAFLQDWTTLGKVVTGTLDLKMNGGTPLTEGFLPVANAFGAEGTSVVADGGLSLDFKVAKALVNKLGLQPSWLTDFKKFGGPFKIKNGTLDMGTWNLNGTGTNARLSGALGLTGGVDVTMRMDVPLSTLQKSKIPGLAGGSGLTSIVQKLAGGKKGDETIPVKLGIGGTMTDPTVEVVDQDALKSSLQKMVKDEGMERVRNLFGN